MKMKAFAVIALLTMTALMPRSVAFAFDHQSISLISTAHADEAQVSPSPSASPVMESSPSPAGMAKVGSDLENLAGKIPLEGVVISVLIFLYDLIRRKMPTKNPAGFIRDLQALIRGVVALLKKLDELGDKIIGQNLK